MLLFYVVALFGLLLAYWSNLGVKNSNDFKYKQYGDRSNPPLVIVPGLDGCTAFFADIIPELTTQYSVFVFYLPLVDNDTKDSYTFDFLSNSLESVLSEAAINGPVIVVGESFGGVVAQNFAYSFPNRISGLVLLSSLAKTNLPPEIEFKVQYLLPVVTAIGGLFPKWAQYLFALVHVHDVVEQSEPDFVRDLFIKEARYVPQKLNLNY